MLANVRTRIASSFFDHYSTMQPSRPYKPSSRGHYYRGNWRMKPRPRLPGNPNQFYHQFPLPGQAISSPFYGPGAAAPSAQVAANYGFPRPPSFYTPRQVFSADVQYSASTTSSGFGVGNVSGHVFKSFQMQRRPLSTTPPAERLPAVNKNDVGNASEPIYISSEESDVEEIGAPPEVPEVAVPGLSLTGREWESVATDSTETNNGGYLDFSMMSYNILSQQLLLENSYLYRSCPPPTIEEDRRISRIIDDIRAVMPDIMCLQEIEAKLFYEKLKPTFEPMGYHCLYKKRTGYKPDGCALLISSKKFDIDSYREVEYYEPDVDLLDRDNVAIVAVVEVKNAATLVSSNNKSNVSDTPARLVIANTHLLFNQRRGDVKLAQLQYLMAEIDRMALFGVDATSGPYRLLVYYPVLLCGDMNLEPYSPLYKFITEGYLKFEGIPRSLMSGQAISFGPGGPGPVMSRTLLPDSFGLADNSEFAETCTIKNSMNSCVNAITGGPVIADVERDVTRQMNSADTSQARKYYSGAASHPFLLRPVYKYDTIKRGDFTSMTRGNRHTVDHMFYSVVRPPSESNSNQTPVHEGRLRLLRRLRVPTTEVVNNGSIPQPSPSLPTKGVPSDHVPLLAEFRFEIPRAIAVPSSSL